ncbi:MAG TPA: hypothetical protein VEI03_15810 [Stellaceae bacterium]|nr:hypothetical protein [Stellaceae bacterium]
MGDDDPSLAPRESAEALLAALRRLDGEGRLEIRIEPRRLAHIDSPVASEADGNIWAYGGLALATALFLWRGPVPGLAALGLAVAAYLTLGRAYMHRRIERRVREQALASLETWRKLWRFPGLTLAAKDRPGLADCASPDGNWMAFVRALS